jgi:hypothetical protein
MVRNFEVISEKFNVSMNCILLMSSSQSNVMMTIIIELIIWM